MRGLVDAARLRRFMEAFSVEADIEARVYFTGGATAVLYGWRSSTIDLDIKIVPETDRLFRAIPRLKEHLQINVEFASPLDFIPVRRDWEDRSPFIERRGRLSFYHFDLYAQALAKVERGHAQDLDDVQAMLAIGLIDPRRAVEYFDSIEPGLYRYPAVDPTSLRRAVAKIFGSAAPG